MDNRIQAAVDEIISVIETHEVELRAAMVAKKAAVTKELTVKSFFLTGLAKKIRFVRTCVSGEQEENRTYCVFELAGFIPAIDAISKKGGQATVDLAFATEEILERDIIPPLRTWVQNKVDSEPWGGLFGADFTLEFKLETDHVPVKKHKGHEYKTIDILVKDKNRIAALPQRIHDFITKEKYVKVNFSNIDVYGKDIYRYAAENFETVGKIHLLPMSEALLKKAIKENLGWYISDFINWLILAAQLLTDNTGGQTHTPEELLMAYQLCSFLMNSKELNFQIEWEDAYKAASACLAAAAKQGQPDAVDALRTNETPDLEEILNEAEQWVIYKAEYDCDKHFTVSFTVKEENAKAYIAMLMYLTSLIKEGAPKEYYLTFESTVKNYVPVELDHSQKNNFFANAAQYPEAFNALKAYAYTAYTGYESYKYYPDGDAADGVPSGAYAAMALAFANPIEHHKVAIDFLASADLDHANVYSFIEAFAKVCKGAQKKELLSYMEQFG